MPFLDGGILYGRGAAEHPCVVKSGLLNTGRCSWSCLKTVLLDCTTTCKQLLSQLAEDQATSCCVTRLRKFRPVLLGHNQSICLLAAIATLFECG
jgi:hypothetical protein